MSSVSSFGVNPELTAVIPLGGKSPNLEVLLSWMTVDILTRLKVIIILDGLAPETKSKYRKRLIEISPANVKVLETNCKNPGGARNIGISSIDTTWTSFWDADDIPDVDQVLSAISDQAPTISAIRGRYSIKNINSDNIVMVEEETLTNDLSLLFTTGPGLWRYVFKTESISNVRFPEISMAEDQIFLFNALKAAGSITEVSRNFYTYQTNNSEQLTNSREKLTDLSKAFELLIDDFDPNAINKASSFETIISRIILTARLNRRIFARIIYRFLITRKISGSVKLNIIIRTSKAIIRHLGLR
jgi:hypothetical protein